MFRPFRPSRRALLAIALAGIAATVLGSCRDSTSPPVMLELRGTATRNGAVMPGARVILLDRRTSIEPGHVLGSATTDAAGRYEIRARAQRPGYQAGCEFLDLFIEGYEYSTSPSAPLRCNNGPQTIDLNAFDLDARRAASVHEVPLSRGVALMRSTHRGEGG